MFSIKKSNFTSPLAWVRRKVGGRSRRSVDVEGRVSSSVSTAGEAPAVSSSLSTSRQEERRNVIMVRSRECVKFDVPGSSQSEPIIGPRSNLDDFRLVSENGNAIEKAKSTGAIPTAPGPSDPAGGSRPMDIAEEALGVRRRIRKNAGGNGGVAGHSSTAAGIGSAPNRVTNRGNVGANQGGREIGLVPMGHGAPAATARLEVVKRPQYLHAFLDAMYFTGTSLRLPFDRRGRVDWPTLLVSILILLEFCIMTILSIWDSVNQGKVYSLYFLSGEGMSEFMEFAYNVFCFATKVYAAYRFTWLNDETDLMLTSISEYDRENDPQADCHCNVWKLVIFCMCVGTLIMAFLEASFDRGFEEWSFEVMGTEKSFEFSQNLYLWSYRNLKERNKELIMAYGTPDTYRIGFAISATLLSICSNFHMGTLRDVVLVGVFVIFVIVFALMKGFAETMEDAPKGDVAASRALQGKREAQWKKYRKVKFVIGKFNMVFDTLLILIHTYIHVDNLLLAGFFASMCIDVDRTDVGAFVYINCAFNLLKVEITYFLAGGISAQNGIVRKWLRNWACHGIITIDGEEYDAHMLMDEVKKEPLAIGSGIFQMNQEFHLKYHGFAGSLVLFLADEKKKTAQCCSELCTQSTTKP